MLRKLLICPWFGPLPSWYEHWQRNIARLKPYGFDVVVPQDQADFNTRAEKALHIEDAVKDEPRKLCDFRHSFALIYPDLIEGYDFWGHTDLDMVYGRVEDWVTDDFLHGLDIHSNHEDYISGPWTLYRNKPVINSLFAVCTEWRDFLRDSKTHGWGEKEYTTVVDNLHDAGHLVRVYTNWQTRNLDSFDTVRFDGDRLLEGREEVMVAHFRRVKEYPAGCVR